MALTDNQSWLYKEMTGKRVNLGSEDDFAAAMQDEKNRQWVYERAGQLGLNVGTPEQFASAMTSVGQPAHQAQEQRSVGATSDGGYNPRPVTSMGGYNPRPVTSMGGYNPVQYSAQPFVEQKKQPNALQTFYKGLGAGVINTANGLLGFLNRANSGQLANDPVTLQQMAKQGKSPEEIAQAADATRARLDNAESERYETWKKKADQLAAEAKPDGGEKSFTDYLSEGKIGKALQLGLGTAAESLPYTASALNPLATAAMIMSMSEQNYRQSLIDNPDMSDGKRIASAVGNAAIEMAVEHIGNPFKVFKAGKLTAPTATKWIKQVVQESKDNIYKGILRVLGFGAKEAAKEGGEEVITTAGQDLYNTLLDWKDTNGLGLRSQWERAKQNDPNITPGQFALDKAEGLTNDFIGGALSGMMMSGPSTGVGIVQNAKYYSKNGGSEASRTQADQQLAVLQQLSDEFGVSQEEVAQAIVDYQAEKQLTPNQQAIINRGEEILTAIQQSEQAAQEAEQVQQQKEIVIPEGITPTEEIGRWGNVYEGMVGSFKRAADFLLQKKSGFVKDVFYNEDKGNVGLIWGSDKEGLQHMIKRHVIEQDDFESVNEMLSTIDDVIANPDNIEEYGNNRNFYKGKHKVVAIKDEDGQWVLTAYDTSRPKGEKKRSREDATRLYQSIFGPENGNLVSPNSASDDKGTTNYSNMQINPQEIVQEVQFFYGERTHGDGNVYPVQMAGNAERQGFVVGSVSPAIDETGRITNNEVVTVKWSDGTVTQENAKELNLTATPGTPDTFIQTEVANRMEQAAAEQAAVKQVQEQLPEGTAIFVNDTEEIAATDNGDGTYSYQDAQGMTNVVTPEQMAEQGYALIEGEQQPAAPADVQQPEAEQPKAQQPQSEQPSAPVEPVLDQMTAADYAGAAVEYMGSRERVDKFLEAEIANTQSQLKAAERKKVTRYNGMADFNAQQERIDREKKALQDRLDKLTEAREKAKSYLTIAEREQRAQAEAERKAAEEAARIAREQAAAAEAARLEQERIDRELKKGVPDFSEDNDRDARNRGFHVVNGQVIRRQEPLQPLATGKAVTVQFAKGQNGSAEAHHVLVPISMVQPSHINGQRNPAFFISEAQPKDRRDQVSKVTSDMMAQNIHPDEIVEGATAYVGAPVVNGRGEAVQGNNRMDALIKMYQSHPESVAKYKQYLIDNAAALGYTEADIETIRNNDVIDVRMLDNVTDEQAIQLGQKKATDLETGGVQLIDPQVTANQLGDRIQRFSEILLRSEDDEATLADLTLRNGRPALEFLQKLDIISDAQMQSAFESRGNLTAEAKAALQGVLKQVLFQNAESDNLPIMFDDIPVTAQKAILQTIVRDLQSPQESRLVPYIQEAIGALYRALHQSAEVKNGRNEQEIRAAMRSWALQMQFPSDFDAENFVPSEKFSNFALELATLFKYGKQTEIAKALNAYYDAVQGTGSLFGDTPAIPYNEAVKQIFNIDYERKREVGTAVADNGEAGDGGRREQPAVDTDRESGSDESRSAVAGTGDNAAGSGIGSSAEGTGDTGDVTQAEREAAKVENPQENLQESEKSSTFAVSNGQAVSKAEYQQQLGDYLQTIKDADHEPYLCDNSTLMDAMEVVGASANDIAKAQDILRDGGHIDGVYLKGYVILNIDELNDFEKARSKYVHERQHDLTRKNIRRVQEVMKAASEQELKDLLFAYTGHHLYDRGSYAAVADEFISFSMEEAYKVDTDEELENVLKSFGVKDELINITCWRN